MRIGSVRTVVDLRHGFDSASTKFPFGVPHFSLAHTTIFRRGSDISEMLVPLTGVI